eukprot:CAMPEP_0172205678 /NCGR_PEP_ID=MMETSP1050-20130122/32755_1 /TAXON_ID=233186 /ORGANISM="Cryptomonas curvata, Strain CCAP979/52" /LENGTH=192 /DNA_ID=CAMNT_0012884595 /DNA_START=1165 /DNA_END=1741 /DNA_ORIENTATION=+
MAMRVQNRTEPILLRAVEVLDRDASWELSEIKVAELPDDVKWALHESDGIECVAVVHTTWGSVTFVRPDQSTCGSLTAREKQPSQQRCATACPSGMGTMLRARRCGSSGDNEALCRNLTEDEEELIALSDALFRAPHHGWLPIATDARQERGHIRPAANSKGRADSEAEWERGAESPPQCGAIHSDVEQPGG